MMLQSRETPGKSKTDFLKDCPSCYRTQGKERIVIPLSNKLSGDIFRLVPRRAADAWGDELGLKHTELQDHLLKPKISQEHLEKTE